MNVRISKFFLVLWNIFVEYLKKKAYILFMVKEDDDRVTAIEIKLAYLEDFVNKLQKIAVEQGNLVDTLKAENRVLKAKLSELIEAQEGDIPNRKPPHY